MHATSSYRKTKLIFLPSPNNPTGTANTEEEIFAFVRSLPEHVIFCFDEAYAEYLESPPDLRPLIREGKKVICLRTFSKIHGLAALRIGYGYSSNEMISLLQQARQPFNVNSIAQAAAIGALADQKWATTCRKRNADGLNQLAKGLDQMGIEYVPSQANFILAKPGNGRSLFLELQKHGIITRALGPNLSDYLRISVGTEVDNARLLEALEKALSVYGVIMIDVTHFFAPSSILLVLWFLCLFAGLYLGVFRSMIDRIRAGISTPVGEGCRAGKLLDSILREPNHARPLHVEAALLSSLQLFLGFFYFSFFWSNGSPFDFALSFSLAFFCERLFSGAIPKILASATSKDMHLAIGYPFVLIARLITWPFSFTLSKLEGFSQLGTKG